MCSDDAYFFENHFIFGVAPGDGMYLIMQQLLGLKRAAYYMYTGENIDALEHNMMHQHFDMAAERETGTPELRKYLPMKIPFTYLD